ncbi:MAG: STY0301 family protein [Pseudomonadota bacterium]
MLLAASASAHAQSVVRCPERFTTTAIILNDPKQAAGFEPVIGGETSSQAWLQDVAVLGSNGARIAGAASSSKRITWAFDGRSPVKIACLYEGGIALTREIANPKGCIANIQRSKTPGGVSWGMDKASFSCR